MPYSDYFPNNYLEARIRFTTLASRAGFEIQSHKIYDNAIVGPNNEDLIVDIATLGSRDAKHTVIISSGMHGIEGFLGSALQTAYLDSNGSNIQIQKDCKLILIHAINPFGFAWFRRVNPNNVDLNRNFIENFNTLNTHTGYEESTRIYNEINFFLNPESPPARFEPYIMKALMLIISRGMSIRRSIAPSQRPSKYALRKIIQLGLEEFQNTLPVGQYTHEKGLFFGGSSIESETKLLQNQIPELVANSENVLHVDLHTGLGDYGHYKLLLADKKWTKQARYVAEIFGKDTVEIQDGQTAYPAIGTMAKYLGNRIPEQGYCCLTAEFGTYKPIKVLGALRAENRAYFHAEQFGKSYKMAKAVALEAFCPKDISWRNGSIKTGLDLISHAIKIGFQE